MQDNRSAFLHNEGARRANEVRQRRATVENPQWAMSRPAEWYQNKENLRSIKPTLTQLKGNQDFLTTDQDEPRNMFQMAINNMIGGGGARMLDTRGLPAGARRIGRTLFTDPAKSQGFLRDVGSLFTGKNQAAVRATEWNPFHEEGYGRDWYVDKFGEPWGDKLEGLMKLALPGPLKFMEGKEREPLPSDRSWIPEGLGEYDEVPYIPFMEDEIVNDDFNWMDPFLENSQIPPQFNIQKLRDEGRSGFINPEDLIPTEVEEVLDDEITDNIDVEIKEKPPFPGDDILTKEETINNQYSFVNEMDHFDSPYDYIMEFKARNENLDIDAIIQNAILNGIIAEKDLNTEMKNLNTQFDLILDQQAGELNKQEDIKREMEKLGLMYNI